VRYIQMRFTACVATGEYLGQTTNALLALRLFERAITRDQARQQFQFFP
jgi:hypothetical protein